METIGTKLEVAKMSELPIGPVTMLLTDIEGSTPLVRRLERCSNNDS